VNSNLYNTSKGEIEFPNDKREHMRLCFLRAEGADENVEGFNRNKELQNQKFIDYKQLKRIKNFFDNFKGNQNELPFILNGGVEIKNWVNDELRKMREFEYLTNKNKMDTGMQNQFIDTHTKDGLDSVRPSKEHSRTVDKYNAAVTESLKRINEIISKI
jgi:hypothetical protein